MATGDRALVVCTRVPLGDELILVLPSTAFVSSARRSTMADSFSPVSDTDILEWVAVGLVRSPALFWRII